MFLFEKWSDNEQMVRIKERTDFDSLFIVLNDGQGGGLALLWKQVQIVGWIVFRNTILILFSMEVQRMPRD